MGINLRNGYEELREHIGHDIETVCYGVPGEDPHNVAIECVTCGCVLLDFDHPDNRLSVQRAITEVGA